MEKVDKKPVLPKTCLACKHWFEQPEMVAPHVQGLKQRCRVGGNPPTTCQLFDSKYKMKLVTRFDIS